MSKAIFKTTQYPILTLINDIDHGKIALPDIQRPFVWDTTKVRDLFDSIYRGYPVGYLLFWDNVEDKFSKNIGTDKKESSAKSLIIDGQQRLTALFATIKGIPIINEDYKEKIIKLAFNPLTETFEVSNVATENNNVFVSDISELFKDGFSEYRFVNDYISKLKENREVTESEQEHIAMNITHLRSILSYDFTILEISESVDEETVANIFVRVNSQGVVLNQADFVLTLLSVFWEEGRIKIENFVKETKDPNYKLNSSSAYNTLMDAGADEILRSSVGYGFGRGRMKDVYSLLRGRDFETREFKPELKETRFSELKQFLDNALDNTNWHDYVNIIQSLGFKHPELITSRTNFFYSYAFYLIGKYKHQIQFRELEKVISRWFLFGAITSRYSGSSESVFEGDLASVRDNKNGEEFINSLQNIITKEITNDYWSITVPGVLESSSARNPLWLIFVAAQIKNNVELLFTNKKISDLFDPLSRPKKTRLDKHHIFPKNYLNKIGIDTQTMQNQIANFVYLDYKTNILISDDAPSEYLPNLIEGNEELLKNHALAKDFFKLEYSEFLVQRRRLIAEYVKNYFESI